MYSYQGISAFLNGKTAHIRNAKEREQFKVPCPVAGCGKSVSWADLERDIPLLHRLAAKRKAAGASASSSSAAAVGAGAGAAASGLHHTPFGEDAAIDFTQADAADDAKDDISQSPPKRVKKEKVEAAPATAAAAGGAAADSNDDPISQTQPKPKPGAIHKPTPAAQR